MEGGRSSGRRTAADDKNKQMGQTMPDNKHNYEYNYDLGDVIDNAVEMGSRIGSSVLGSIADALGAGGRCHGRETTRQLLRVEAPSGAQVEKRRPVCRRCADGGRLDLHRLLWHRGVRAGHPDGSRRRAAGAFQQDFIALPILTAVFTPVNARLPLYGHRGHEKAEPISAACASCCALPMTGPVTCPRWPARLRSSRKRPMRNRCKGCGESGIFPTLPFPMITAPSIWMIRSCRRPQPAAAPQPASLRR